MSKHSKRVFTAIPADYPWLLMKSLPPPPIMLGKLPFIPGYDRLVSESAPEALEDYLTTQLLRCLDQCDALMDGICLWLTKVSPPEYFFDYCIQLEAGLKQFNEALREENVCLELEFLGYYTCRFAERDYHQYHVRFEWVDFPTVTFEFQFSVSETGMLKVARAEWGDRSYIVKLPAQPTLFTPKGRQMKREYEERVREGDLVAELEKIEAQLLTATA